jgi:hypothetical protein
MLAPVHLIIMNMDVSLHFCWFHALHEHEHEDLGAVFMVSGYSTNMTIKVEVSGCACCGLCCATTSPNGF